MALFGISIHVKSAESATVDTIKKAGLKIFKCEIWGTHMKSPEAQPVLYSRKNFLAKNESEAIQRALELGEKDQPGIDSDSNNLTLGDEYWKFLVTTLKCASVE